MRQPHHYHYYCRYKNEDVPFQPLMASKPGNNCWRWCWWRSSHSHDDKNYLVDTRPASVVLGQDEIVGRIVTYTDDTNHFQSRIITLPGHEVFVRW